MERIDFPRSARKTIARGGTAQSTLSSAGLQTIKELKTGSAGDNERLASLTNQVQLCGIRVRL